jgi:WD40-like Beta Propeller Repeat
MRAGFVAVFLVATFTTGCGGHGRAAGTIVFESGFIGREALYAVHPDGSGLTRLLNLPQEADVSWTRDGTKALLLDYGPTSLVFEPASRGRRNIRLPGFETAEGIGPWSDLLWSPDGRRLAYATDNGHIVIVDVRSGVRRRIADGSSDGPVAWSPDGRRVLFIDYYDGAVYAAPVGGGRRVRLLRLPADVDPDALPEWSADGKWISLFNVRGSPAKLYVARADGTRLHSIVRNADDAAWSPTAERLAFAGDRGIVVVDLEHARRRQLTRDPLDNSPAWSPDGERIVYARNDLGRGAPTEHHMRLWTMKSDGSDQRPLTHAFPDDRSNGPAVWVEGSVKGMPVPTLPLVSLRGARTIATSLPIVALTATGDRAAVAQGLGGSPGFRGPLGPIVLWNPVRNSRVRIRIPGCGRAYDMLLDGVVFFAGGVGYRCDNSGVAYSTDDTLRLVRPGKRGTTQIVQTHGDEFSGSLLGELAGDGTAIAFDVGVITMDRRGEVRIGVSHIWKVSGTRKSIVRTFPAEATVASLDAGRIAVIRNGNRVSVLSRDGGVRTFALGGPRVLGAALDGPQLVVLQNTRITVLRPGRRTATWPARQGFGPPPELEGAKGDLAVYVVGAAVHVLRLSDGREIVIDTPNATEPVLARFVPGGLFYSFNASYAKRPGRLVFVARPELERALDSRGRRPTSR